MNTITTRRFDVIAKHLANREAFRTNGALRGDSAFAPFDALLNGHGRLPADWSRTLQARWNLIDYVVWSYATPICWRDKEAGWVVPDEHYSQTTSVHQGRIQAALAFLGEDYSE